MQQFDRYTESQELAKIAFIDKGVLTFLQQCTVISVPSQWYILTAQKYYALNDWSQPLSVLRHLLQTLTAHLIQDIELRITISFEELKTGFH